MNEDSKSLNWICQIPYHWCFIQVTSGDFICQICESFHASIEDWNAHYEREHPQGEYAQETQHYPDDQAKQDRKLQCEECGKHFTSKQGLAYHKKRVSCSTETAPQPVKPKCGFCGKRYSSNQMLRHHMTSVHDVILPALRRGRPNKTDEVSKHERTFCCDQCDKRYTSKQMLSIHVRRVHSVTTHISAQA